MPQIIEVPNDGQVEFPDGMTDEQIDAALLSSVLFLAERGMSARAISEATGLSISQVMYRTKHLEVRLSDYRRGQGQYAQKVLMQTPCARSGLRAQPGEKYHVAGVAAKQVAGVA